MPKFVSDACAVIMENVEVEGLFRKAGSAARQKEIRVSVNWQIFWLLHMENFEFFSLLAGKNRIRHFD